MLGGERAHRRQTRARAQGTATHLHRALFPPGAKATATPNRPREPVSPADFLDTGYDLTGVDCVFLADVSNPTAELAAKLDAVLRRGGTVVIGLGPNAATPASRARSCSGTPSLSYVASSFGSTSSRLFGPSLLRFGAE